MVLNLCGWLLDLLALSLSRSSKLGADQLGSQAPFARKTPRSKLIYPAANSSAIWPGITRGMQVYK